VLAGSCSLIRSWTPEEVEERRGELVRRLFGLVVPPVPGRVRAGMTVQQHHRLLPHRTGGSPRPYAGSHDRSEDG
jgi:hypothetical protein